MKEIKISNEDYKFLQECKHLLKTQDNRGTANPMYCIEREEKVPTAVDYANGSQWFDAASLVTYDDLDELYEALSEDGCLDDKDIDLEKFKEIAKCNDNLEELGLKSIYKVWYKLVNKFNTDAFSFFEQDIEDHMGKLNGHNMWGNCRSYAATMFRIPRMTRLRELVMGLDIEAKEET